MRNQTILFFVFFLTSFTSQISARNFLTRGSHLTVRNASDSDFLISSDNTFTCGFYSLGTNAYWFAIWFTNSAEKTAVWVANRDSPVNLRGSRLTLRENGVMSLTDFDGSIAWESNGNGTASGVERAELLNTGNLVLRNYEGNILWQSFDFPADTLLPHQVFTRRQRLISRMGPHMFASGYFSFLFDTNNVLRMIYDGPEISSIYWPDINMDIYANGRTNYNNSRIAMLDDKGTFYSSDHLEFSASDGGSVGIKRRLTMDYDGNTRVYSLNESTGLWKITWEALAKACQIHGFCGRNGICNYAPEPKCSCPPHYEPADSSDWTRGCRPKFQRNCSFDSAFIEMTHVDYFGFDRKYITPATYEDCKQLCVEDCRCQATSTTSEPVHLNASDLDCGNGHERIVLLPNIYEITKRRFKWIYMYSFASAIGTLQLVILIVRWWFLFRKQSLSASMEDGYQAISNQFKSFSYSELKKATGKFKDVLGRGGFGAVYKGFLTDERVVAVKKLGNVVQGEEEFWAEVSTIGKIYHMNLARMWGFCSEKKHKLLVYEYVENGSLDKHLFSTTTILGWKERFKVALGTAKGLAYLHHECLEWVIHCDVKPENILIDDDFEPKISDFGLAKLCQRGTDGSSGMSRIRGTKGYMAPEWAVNLQITAKVDVYSYGVVILELVKGIRLSSWVVDDELGFEEVPELVRFVRLAKSKFQNGEVSWVEDLVDTRLKGDFSRNQAAMMIEVGLACVDDDRNKRPNMESVVQILSECEDIVMHNSVNV